MLRLPDPPPPEIVTVGADVYPVPPAVTTILDMVLFERTAVSCAESSLPPPVIRS